MLRYQFHTKKISSKDLSLTFTLSEEVREFLLVTFILDHFSAAMFQNVINANNFRKKNYKSCHKFSAAKFSDDQRCLKKAEKRANL